MSDSEKEAKAAVVLPYQRGGGKGVIVLDDEATTDDADDFDEFDDDLDEDLDI